MINTVQTPTELKPQYIYELSASDDFPSDLTPLQLPTKSTTSNSKLLNIPMLNKAHSRVYISKSTVFGTLKLVKIENAEISETLWTKIKNLNKNTIDNFEEIHQNS